MIDLMLRNGKAEKILNVIWSQRLSVGQVFTACALVVLAIWWSMGVYWHCCSRNRSNAVEYRTLSFLSIPSLSVVCDKISAAPLAVLWLLWMSVIVGTVRFYASGRRTTNQ